METKPEITHSNAVIIQVQTEKLKSLDSEFEKHHNTIIDRVNEVNLVMLEQELAVSDVHEDKTANVNGSSNPIEPYKAIPNCHSPAHESENCHRILLVLTQGITHMKSNLKSNSLTVELLTLGPHPDICLM